MPLELCTRCRVPYICDGDTGQPPPVCPRCGGELRLTTIAEVRSVLQESAEKLAPPIGEPRPTALVI